jgi:hypothetical protein
MPKDHNKFISANLMASILKADFETFSESTSLREPSEAPRRTSQAPPFEEGFHHAVKRSVVDRAAKAPMQGMAEMHVFMRLPIWVKACRVKDATPVHHCRCETSDHCRTSRYHGFARCAGRELAISERDALEARRERVEPHRLE